MTERSDGGAAFPVDRSHWHDPGMSLRDWFAGQALAGLIASGHDAYSLTDTDAQGRYAAYRAYVVADAMLAEREKSS